MLKRNLFLLLLQLATLVTLAQVPRITPPKKKDTIRVSWWMGQGAKPTLIAPVLQHPEKKKEITPKQTICFDKKFFVLGEITGHVINTCFLLNSESGISGSFSLYGTDGKCEFETDEPDFHFMLTTLKGITFRYFNREERERQSQPKAIKHYVITGNTHRNQMDEVADQKILLRKDDSYREFLNGTVKAAHYTTGDGKSNLYLVGEQFPKELILREHLGAYGLGYIKTNAGYYLVLGHERGTQFNMAVREIANIGNNGICFPTAAFVTMEEEKIPELIETTEAQERELTKKLDKDLSSSSPCAVKKVEWTSYKLEATKKEKELLSTLKNDKFKATSEADMYKLAAMHNPITAFATERRELEHKLCVLEQDLAQGRVSNKQMGATIQKKQCWENKIAIYKRLEDKWLELESKYKNDKPALIKAMGTFHKDELIPGIRKTKCP